MLGFRDLHGGDRLFLHSSPVGATFQASDVDSTVAVAEDKIWRAAEVVALSVLQAASN